LSASPNGKESNKGKVSMKHNRQSESGNILWFIMLAIALLALLTIVLSRGGSSVDQSGNLEQQRVKASQVLRYAKSIETAVQQMKLRGISENDISFENTTTSVDYTNANCTSDDCLVFHVNGGGLVYQAPPSGANNGAEWIFSGANNVGTTANPVGTTSAVYGNDLLMLLPNANTSLCQEINRDLGVGTAGTLPVDTGGIDDTEFTGTFIAGGPTILDGDPTPFELDGVSAGCFVDDNASITYFYYVILAR
jgi:type II secretory pathway pseudopilin PulG